MPMHARTFTYIFVTLVRVVTRSVTAPCAYARAEHARKLLFALATDGNRRQPTERQPPVLTEPVCVRRLHHHRSHAVLASRPRGSCAKMSACTHTHTRMRISKQNISVLFGETSFYFTYAHVFQFALSAARGLLLLLLDSKRRFADGTQSINTLSHRHETSHVASRMSALKFTRKLRQRKLSRFITCQTSPPSLRRMSIAIAWSRPCSNCCLARCVKEARSTNGQRKQLRTPASCETSVSD